MAERNPGAAPEERAPEIELDRLTGVPSRRAFLSRLDERTARACSQRSGFGLCIVDLDHFKSVNLSHGLTRGDAALRDVAEQLVRTISARTDALEPPLVARFDGDAFVVVLEQETPSQVAATAEAFREAIAVLPAIAGHRLTASVGAVFARIGESADAIVLRAEQALHLAKQFGRDRVEVSQSPAPLGAPGLVVGLRRSTY